MALGNKKSENSAAGAGTPPPPPPFMEPTPPEGLISALDDRLQQLQATVTALVERTAGSAAAPAEDTDVMTASRTLKMAEQTADAMIAEARDEAAKVLAGAREQHESMVAAARKAADTEFAAQREAVTVETARWEARKRELLDLFSKIETQLTECDGRLADAHQLVRGVLDHPGLAPLVEGPPVVTAPPAPPTATGTAPPTAATEPPPVVSSPIEAGPASPSAPVEEATDAEPAKETVFGNPPAPVFTAPAKEESSTQAFYPWSGNSTPGPAEADATDVTDAPDATGSSEAPLDSPAPPPVQRRGLFGH
jgi:hypothetical protein